MFIPSSYKDNPFINASLYEAQIRSGVDDATARALLSGDWNAVKGGFFEGIWRNAVHVIPDREPRKGTYRFRSCDWGYNHYCSVTWWELDHDDVMTAYHNLYVKKHTAVMLARRIREIEEHYGDWDTFNDMSMLTGPIDQQGAYTREGRYPSPAEDMMKLGVRWWGFTEKNRLAGADQIRKRMLARTAVGDPKIRWMKRCTAPIDKLPNLVSDPHNAEDILKPQSGDDLYDELQYACLSRPIKPEKSGARNPDAWLDELATKRIEKGNRRGELVGFGGG